MPVPSFPPSEFDGFQAEFLPGTTSTHHKPFAALVIPWHNDQIVLVNVAGRGWCIPSGRVEPGETPDQTAHRESNEEAGITLSDLILLGVYKLSRDGKITYAALYTAASTAPGAPKDPDEILDVKTCLFEDLPETYYTWNPLFEAVFAYAAQNRP